jgi:hypothetical protein
LNQAPSFSAKARKELADHAPDSFSAVIAHLRLMQVCGMQLIVEMAPYDDQDSRQATEILRVPTPEARLAAMPDSVNAVRRLVAPPRQGPAGPVHPA